MTAVLACGLLANSGKVPVPVGHGFEFFPKSLL